ncbi:MAG: hypothetical protein LQ340_001306 [Diploschistes diacapsis]|nr:MAG: hypothetical protein LQ340_001306 [Diploschistes diacapsis]
MISELQDQLQFVRAVQSVDTEGVEPLRAVRDETEAGRRESEVTLETLKGELEKEEVVGFARRIRRKKAVGGEKKGKGGNVEDGEKGAEEGRTTQGWELLKQAPEKRGRYVVVNTAKS